MNRRLSSSACCILLGAAGFFVPALRAQDYPPPPPPPPSEETVNSLQQLPPLEQLLAPIALYPDPVIALILPASTLPEQLQAAAANPADPNFDPSIRGLEHYPEVLRWMASNATWTQQLGGAFANSPSDVMNAIQSLRQRARAAGTLVPSSFEQIVVDANDQIEILPSNPTEIYLPTYNPQVVYWGYPGGYPSDYFGWSRPYAAGDWLTFDFDWREHALWRGNWYGYHREYGWNRRPDYERWHREGTADGDRRGEGQRAEMWRAPANRPPRPDFRDFRGGQGNRDYRGSDRGDHGELQRQNPGSWQGRPQDNQRPPPGGYAPRTSAQPNSPPQAYAPQAYGPRGYIRPSQTAGPAPGQVPPGGYRQRDYGGQGGSDPRNSYRSGGPGRPANGQPQGGQPPEHQDRGGGQGTRQSAPPPSQRAAPAQQPANPVPADRDRDHERQR